MQPPAPGASRQLAGHGFGPIASVSGAPAKGYSGPTRITLDPADPVTFAIQRGIALRIQRVADATFNAITAILLMIMVALTLLQVITRYALHAGFDWTEELARLDLIYLTFFGSIVAFRRREHLRIE